MIKYFLISRKNPITKEYAFHANAMPVTPVKLDEIAENISNNCTVNAADIKAVLYALQTEIIKCLRNGQSVRLGDLGSFHARLSSKAAATEEAFREKPNDFLRGVLVRFTPSSKMRWEMSLKNPNVSVVAQ
jgi:predicted histone-like DNA-binding protein